MPLITTDPIDVSVAIVDGQFEGVVKSPVGDIPIVGKYVDTTKLVVAPYDDPQPILGKWDVRAVFGAEEHDAVLTVDKGEYDLLGTITTADNEWKTESIEFKKVSDTMSVVRMTVNIPDVKPEALQFEIILDGDGFEGEEIRSNGEIHLTGARAPS